MRHGPSGKPRVTDKTGENGACHSVSIYSAEYVQKLPSFSSKEVAISKPNRPVSTGLASKRKPLILRILLKTNGLYSAWQASVVAFAMRKSVPLMSPERLIRLDHLMLWMDLFLTFSEIAGLDRTERWLTCRLPSTEAASPSICGHIRQRETCRRSNLPPKPPEKSAAPRSADRTQVEGRHLVIMNLTQNANISAFGASSFWRLRNRATRGSGAQGVIARYYTA